MKLLPYYKRTITSPLTNDSVLNKFESIISEQRTNNFPEKEGFIGGDIINGQFKIFRTGKLISKAFPVTATGQQDGNGNWILTFATGKWNIIWFLLTFGAMTFVTIKYGTFFFVPLMIIYYVSAQVAFNKDCRTLEIFISNELGAI